MHYYPFAFLKHQLSIAFLKQNLNYLNKISMCLFYGKQRISKHFHILKCYNKWDLYIRITINTLEIHHFPCNYRIFLVLSKIQPADSTFWFDDPSQLLWAKYFCLQSMRVIFGCAHASIKISMQSSYTHASKNHIKNEPLLTLTFIFP